MMGYPRGQAWPGLCWLVVLLAAGCTPRAAGKGTDTASGGDHQRDLARKIPLDRTVTDSVSAVQGDHTDWKYIEIPEDGTLQITVAVENPHVTGTIILSDEQGEALQRTVIRADETSYPFEFPVEAGRKYYILVALSQHETVYSIGNQFERKSEASIVVLAEPELRRRAPPPPQEPPRTGSPTDDAEHGVISRILIVRPWKEEKASRLTFPHGADRGITRGAVVAISTGGSCVVQEVFSASSFCIVDRPPTEFQEGTPVVIRQPAATGSEPRPIGRSEGAAPLMRTGGIRLKALHSQQYYISYLPDAQLRWPELDQVLVHRPPAVQIRPFTQEPTAPGDQAFDVERGGEIVALALARQFDLLGWDVELEPRAGLLEQAHREFPARESAALGDQDARTRPPLPARELQRLLSVLLSGRVRFQVAAEQRSGTAVHVARLQGEVDLQSQRAGQPIYHRRIEVTQETSSQEEARRTHRAQRAAAGALTRFVQELFRDPALQQALVREARVGR